LTRQHLHTSDGVCLSKIVADPACLDPSLPVVAFVPGWCMPASIWENQLAAISARHLTLALDPRGQGESEVPETGYNFERRAADLHDFLQPYENVLLVGWSLGALEALHYVHLYGACKLAGLVLADRTVDELPKPPPESRFLDALREDRDNTLGDFVRAMYAKRRTEEEESTLLREVKRMSLDNSIALLSSSIPREHWKEIAHAYTKPLLYVVTPQFAEQAENLKTNRPDTRIEIFTEAGHALFADEPERFNALMLEFAASVQDGT
jgi:non-heme chloroperoxidase